MLKCFAFIGEFEFLLGHKWETAQAEFLLQTLLIHRLQKARAHFPINLKDSALNGIDLILEKQFFVCFVYLVVHKA